MNSDIRTFIYTGSKRPCIYIYGISNLCFLYILTGDADKNISGMIRLMLPVLYFHVYFHTYFLQVV